MKAWIGWLVLVTNLGVTLALAPADPPAKPASAGRKVLGLVARAGGV